MLANEECDEPNCDGETPFLEWFPGAESIVIQDAGHTCALQQPVDKLMARTTG